VSNTLRPSDQTGLLHHGGRVREAAARYAIPVAEWVDLSTGTNPHGWPVPALSPRSWSRLPEDEDGLIETAREYYATESILAVSGSQAAIQALPGLRDRSRVGVLFPTYAEHAHAWRTQHHHVIPLPEDKIERRIDALDVLVLVNPNNPTGWRFDKKRLLSWHNRLQEGGGWLLVDEAFMDVTPEESLASLCPLPGLVVLRSLGKFFGLAGARVGFVIAERGLLDVLEKRLGPWCVAGPSREVANLSLSDAEWQQETRASLPSQAERLFALMHEAGLTPTGGTALYQWARTSEAATIHDQLARQGILIRLFDEPASIRIGLPANEREWQRLALGLGTLKAAVT
jgi:cobalamin biosynthetic protein CobC